MNKILILSSFLVFWAFVIFCLIVLFLINIFAGKRKNAFYSIRENFKKRHPVIAKLLTIIPVTFLIAVCIWYSSIHVIDLVNSNVLSCEGKVISISSGALLNNNVYLNSGIEVINFSKYFNIEVGKSYIFYYAPHTKIIIKIETVS